MAMVNPQQALGQYPPIAAPMQQQQMQPFAQLQPAAPQAPVPTAAPLQPAPAAEPSRGRGGGLLGNLFRRGKAQPCIKHAVCTVLAYAYACVVGSLSGERSSLSSSCTFVTSFDPILFFALYAPQVSSKPRHNSLRTRQQQALCHKRHPHRSSLGMIPRQHRHRNLRCRGTGRSDSWMGWELQGLLGQDQVARARLSHNPWLVQPLQARQAASFRRAASCRVWRTTRAWWRQAWCPITTAAR